jgi:hypothetical protein
MNTKFRTLIALLALAAPTTVDAQFSFTIGDGAVTITGYTGQSEAVVIPGEIDGYPVTSIATNAFSQNTNVASVNIPGSIINIGTAAFLDCYYLTNAVMGAGVVSIGEEAFENTGLETVTIPGTVTSIQALAFWGCHYLQSVAIPGSVATIAEGAFANTGLTNAAIADGVTSIGSGAFNNFTLESLVIPASVTNIGYGAFAGDPGPIAVDPQNQNLASPAGRCLIKTKLLSFSARANSLGHIRFRTALSRLPITPLTTVTP